MPDSDVKPKKIRLETKELGKAIKTDRQTDIVKNDLDQNEMSELENATTVSITTSTRRTKLSASNRTAKTKNLLSKDNILNGAVVLTFAGLEMETTEGTTESLETNLPTSTSNDTEDVMGKFEKSKESTKKASYSILANKTPAFMVFDKESKFTTTTTTDQMQETTTEISKSKKKKDRTKQNTEKYENTVTSTTEMEDVDTYTSATITVPATMSTTEMMQTTLESTKVTTSQKPESLQTNSQQNTDKPTTTDQLSAVNSLSFSPENRETQTMTTDAPTTVTPPATTSRLATQFIMTTLQKKLSSTPATVHAQIYTPETSDQPTTTASDNATTYLKSAELTTEHTTLPSKVDVESSTTSQEQIEKESDVKTILVISLSIVGAVALILLIGFMVILTLPNL